MKKWILFLVITGFLLASCSVIDNNPNTAAISTSNYEMISVTKLQSLMESEDFTFINVHIPLDGNIPETDLEIPYNDIQNYTEFLPKDKTEKIVIYCRSGSMGDVAAAELVHMGYSDVTNLEGGYIAWRAAGLPFEEME